MSTAPQSSAPEPTRLAEPLTEPAAPTAPTTAPARPAVSPLVRLAIEAGPLAVFFVVNNIYGIMIGTAAFMAATSVSLTISYVLERRLPIMPVVGCFFVLLFGALTLLLDDDLFIKIKPTVVNLLFASILVVGLLLKRAVLKQLMGAVLELDDDGWRKLSARWAVFFVFLAILNEIVWRNFSTDTWVAFKVFGIMPLSLVFGAAQVPLILKHQLNADDASEAEAMPAAEKPIGAPADGSRDVAP